MFNQGPIKHLRSYTFNTHSSICVLSLLSFFSRNIVECVIYFIVICRVFDTCGNKEIVNKIRSERAPSIRSGIVHDDLVLIHVACTYDSRVTRSDISS